MANNIYKWAVVALMVTELLLILVTFLPHCNCTLSHHSLCNGGYTGH